MSASGSTYVSASVDPDADICRLRRIGYRELWRHFKNLSRKSLHSRVFGHPSPPNFAAKVLNISLRPLCSGGAGALPTKLKISFWSGFKMDPGRTEEEILAGILERMKEESGNPGLEVKDIDILLLAPFREVQNLMWIKRNPVHSAALEEWDRKEKLLTSRVDKKEKRSGSLKNEIYQLVGFFSVFQGVVLTAVTQLTQSQDQSRADVCKKVWSPALLTALAWLVTTVGVWQKLSGIEALDCARDDEDRARREVVQRANALRGEGKKYNFLDLKAKRARDDPKVFRSKRIWDFWTINFGVVFASLSVFTGIFIASYFLILCNRGLAPIR